MNAKTNRIDHFGFFAAILDFLEITILQSMAFREFGMVPYTQALLILYKLSDIRNI